MDKENHCLNLPNHFVKLRANTLAAFPLGFMLVWVLLISNAVVAESAPNLQGEDSSLHTAQQIELPQQNTQKDAHNVETFIPPTRLDIEPAQYPRPYQLAAREGWVDLNYMIDNNGKPYDITIADSSDGRLFEKNAIKAVEQWRYNPAMLNGEPIHAGAAHRLTFRLNGKSGARARFIRRYRKLVRLIEEQDKVKAVAQLELLTNTDRNLYEEAFYQLGHYFFQQEWGTEYSQYQHLRRAAFIDAGRDYLESETMTRMLQSQLRLALKLNKLMDAKRLITELNEREISDELALKLERINESVRGVIASESPLVSPARISHFNRHIHNLARNRFSIADIEGDVAELHLHCDRGYVGFSFDPKVVYQVQQGWSNCALIVIGNPGTIMSIVEG